MLRARYCQGAIAICTNLRNYFERKIASNKGIVIQVPLPFNLPAHMPLPIPPPIFKNRPRLTRKHRKKRTKLGSSGYKKRGNKSHDEDFDDDDEEFQDDDDDDMYIREVTVPPTLMHCTTEYEIDFMRVMQNQKKHTKRDKLDYLSVTNHSSDRYSCLFPPSLSNNKRKLDQSMGINSICSSAVVPITTASAAAMPVKVMSDGSNQDSQTITAYQTAMDVSTGMTHTNTEHDIVSNTCGVNYTPDKSSKLGMTRGSPATVAMAGYFTHDNTPRASPRPSPRATPSK